jgi:hypothetical protein
MPTKKKTTSGPKATLMKKNLAQLKAQAKKLKIKGFSTKKKEALVNSIMMAQARKKKSSTPKKSMATGGKRMMKKRGAKPNRVMRRPVRMAQRRRPMMSEYNGWANWYTWATNLYFEHTFQMIVDEAAENPGGAYLPEDAYELGEVYKDLVEEMNDEVLQGDGTYYINDMVNRGMLEVDWTEIARHYIE